jgi:hypothetical protein
MPIHVLLETTVQDIKSSYGNLIFMGLFVLGCIGAIIWWIRRN